MLNSFRVQSVTRFSWQTSRFRYFRVMPGLHQRPAPPRLVNGDHIRNGADHVRW